LDDRLKDLAEPSSALQKESPRKIVKKSSPMRRRKSTRIVSLLVPTTGIGMPEVLLTFEGGAGGGGGGAFFS
jgi:hypothetical protein